MLFKALRNYRGHYFTFYTNEILFLELESKIDSICEGANLDEALEKSKEVKDNLTVRKKCNFIYCLSYLL